MLKPDILLNINFYATSNGGRKGPTPTDFFNCVFEIDGQNFSGRMLLDEISAISPGSNKNNVPVKFLYYDKVKDKLHIGTKIYIRDGGIIGDGVITSVEKDGGLPAGYYDSSEY